MRIATVEQMRRLDAAAIKERGIPSLELMENAARAVADEVCSLLKDPVGKRVVCYCGTGNNGGDGVAVARLLLEQGAEVRCFLAGRRDKMSQDCAAMEKRLIQVGGCLEAYNPADREQVKVCQSADAIVDALFGIGLNTELRGAPLTAVEYINASPAPVVAVDVPSGVEADTGIVPGQAVEAAVTVTFTLPKVGCCVGEGATCAGRLVVADIGIPADLVDVEEYPVQMMERCDVSLPRRARDSNKTDYGRVYILGGSMGYTGAPVLAASAAVRAGAGLVSVGVPVLAWSPVAAKLTCAMPHPLPSDKEGRFSLEAAVSAMERMSHCGVSLVGPGLGRSGGVSAVVRRIVREHHGPLVLDADGINALEGHIDILDERRGDLTVLTPHDGEFARLGGDLSGGDRLSVARAFAEEHGCCLVLKGYRTITAFPDGTAWVNTTGNPGLAKGGSGDVLAGIILALLGQGLCARRAVPMAVWIHGMAGDLAAEALGEYGMTPVDVVDLLPRVTKDLIEA